MGHANLNNISNFFIRRLYAKGRLSIATCVKSMIDKGIEVQASEGSYGDEYMLSYTTEIVVGFLRGKLDYYDQREKILEPVSLNPEQQKILLQHDDNDQEHDEEGFAIFDSIEWKFTKGWRKQYPDIPHVGYFGN